MYFGIWDEVSSLHSYKWLVELRNLQCHSGMMCGFDPDPSRRPRKQNGPTAVMGVNVAPCHAILELHHERELSRQWQI